MPQIITKVDEAITAKRENAEKTKKLRELLEKAKAENRSLTEEEKTSFENISKDIEERSQDISRFEKAHYLETGEQLTGRSVFENPNKSENTKNTEKREAFNKYLRTDLSEKEYRSLEVTTQEKGGNIVAPEEFVNEILKKVDEQVKIRSLSTVTRLEGAKSLGVSTFEKDLDDYNWTAEIGKVAEDTNMTFGKRIFKPNQLSKLVKISEFLIKNRPDISSFVAERLAYKIAGTLEKHYMQGDGQDKPLGLFTASNDGISTNRDLEIGTSSKPITYEGLVDAIGAINEVYRDKAVWILNRSVISALMKLVDENKRPIWQQSLLQGSPNILLGIPVIESAFAPKDLTTGKYIGLLGDLKKYWIVDSVDFELKVLNELYAETNQIGYLGKYWGDGQPIMEEAFIRLKVGA